MKTEKCVVCVNVYSSSCCVIVLPLLLILVIFYSVSTHAPWFSRVLSTLVWVVLFWFNWVLCGHNSCSIFC